MGLTQNRPEMDGSMTEMVQAMRDGMTSIVIRDQLNIAEAVNAIAHVLASVLVGAYSDKEREVVVSTFPDVVRAYFPQWEKIYDGYRRSVGHT